MKHKWLFLVVPLVLLFIVIEGFLLRLDLDNLAKSDNLPVIKISLNGVTLEHIISRSKDIKYEGNNVEVIIGDDVRNFSDVQIKGRGNSTWDDKIPKRPFQIKFDKKVDILGLGSRKKYNLLANAYDDSLIRNALLFKMTEMIDEKYRSKGEFVELYIDDEYQGLYNLTTKVEIGKEAIDLRDDYGILIELDTLHTVYEECLEGEDEECLILKDAVFEDDDEVVAQAIESFLKDYKDLVKFAKRGDYKRLSEVIDVKTFAEYYLISEFAVNPDAYVSSFYFYKNGLSDKIHAGPLWDYDFAFSNHNWVWNSRKEFFSPTETMVQKQDVFSEKHSDSDTGKLMYYLMDIPEFRMEVEKIFHDRLSNRKAELINWIFKEGARIRKAAEKDSERWSKDKDVFYKDMKHLIDWVSERYDYFEKEYNSIKEWKFKPGVI